MTTRRNILAAAVAAPILAGVASAQLLENKLSSNSTTTTGSANRSLAALEETWIKTRFYSEAMMEEGRVPRDVWVKAKLNAIHGNFDIRDPDNGDLLQKVVKGVRVPPAP
jgi:hypothetical protein